MESAWTCGAIALCVLSLYLLRFGFDIAGSDQDEWVPMTIASLDVETYKNDWFVSKRGPGLQVRSFVTASATQIARLLRLIIGDDPFTQVLGSVGVLHGLSWLLLLLGAIQIARKFTDNHLTVAIVCLATFVLTPQWTLGGNDFAHAMFVPSMLAWGLALCAIGAYLHDRFVIAFGLAALATWSQALVGLQVGGLLFIVGLWKLSTSPSGTTRSFAMGFVIFVVAVLPLVWALAVSGSTLPLASEYQILAVERAPHHYILSEFPLAQTLKFVVLLSAGIVTAKAIPTQFRSEWYAVILVSLLALCTAAIASVTGSSGFGVGRLQLFKFSLIVKLFSVVSVALYAENALLRNRRERPYILVVASLLSMALLIVAFSTDRGQKRVARYQNYLSSPEFEIASWSRMHVPKDAVVLIPPSDSRFRIHAARSVVVNFKSVPFDDIEGWHRRLQSLCPSSPQISQQMDQCFNGLSAGALARIARRWEASHVLRRDDCVLEDEFGVANQADAVCLYSMDTANDASD